MNPKPLLLFPSFSFRSRHIDWECSRAFYLTDFYFDLDPSVWVSRQGQRGGLRAPFFTSPFRHHQCPIKGHYPPFLWMYLPLLVVCFTSPFLKPWARFSLKPVFVFLLLIFFVLLLLLNLLCPLISGCLNARSGAPACEIYCSRPCSKLPWHRPRRHPRSLTHFSHSRLSDFFNSRSITRFALSHDFLLRIMFWALYFLTSFELIQARSTCLQCISFTKFEL